MKAKKSETKTFTIPVSYEMCGTINVQAASLEEAIMIVEDADGLPDDATYVDGSFKVDAEFAEETNSI